MIAFLREIDRRDRLLSRCGWLMIALLIVMLATIPFDDRTILGLNPWIKPSKFAVSIAIYLWTLAWFMPVVTGPAWAKGLIRWGTALAMVVEMVCIAGQSLRGTASHFNDLTPVDNLAFTLMGLFVLFITLLQTVLLVLLFVRHAPVAPAYLWGLRYGVAGAIFGGVIGFLMVNNAAHSVGGADGGPGLPILNWSTEWGDLRISHGLALHSLQILPLIGYLLTRHRPRVPLGVQLAGVATAAVGYGLLIVTLLILALSGQPLVAAFVPV